ncbi:hypothetical protein HA402_008676 [Bradysia odoriphaga]|nr:hypothetical protein HA402_008676 [Bradysia odoriphaga]
MDYIIKLYKDWRLHSEFKEIVSEMEDDYFFTEKHSIRESARSLKKYGSTCNHVRNELLLIRHELEKTDTLQGIALKYGCTTEQIRRANRLFAQDSLFLRQFLMIPVDKDSPYYPKEDRPQSLPTGSSNNARMADMQTNSPNSQSMTVLSPEEENRKDIDEFMGKIDSTLAQTKKYVAKSQNSFDFVPPSDENLFTTNHRHFATSPSTSSTSSRHHTRNSSSGSDTIQLLTMTSGRRVQNSLQRLEKQQDEFFEL